MKPTTRDRIDTALNVPTLVREGRAAVAEAFADADDAVCDTVRRPAPAELSPTLGAEVESILLRVIERARGLP